MNEKLKILKMLEEGKITAEQASKMLENPGASVPPPSSSYGPPPYPSSKAPGYYGATPGAPYPPSGSGYASSASNDPSGRRHPSSDAYYRTPSEPRHDPKTSYPGSSFAEDIGKKVETFFKDVEPKFQKFTETFVEKTSSAADSIAKSFSTPTPPPKHGQYGGTTSPKPTPPRSTTTSSHTKGRLEKNFEIKVMSADSELILAGWNGQVLLKGYNGDKITAKVIYSARRSGSPIEMMTLGRKYYLNYDENDFESVSVDAYIPETMFSDIKVTTNGGALIISTVRARNSRFENSNGDVEINGFSAADLFVETNNGNMRLSDVSAERAVIDDFGGSINAVNVDIAQMKMSTFNGGISLQMSKYEFFANYDWAVEANNGKVSMILPSSVDIGYHIRANAALSDVKVGLTGLNYISNSRSFAEAQSVNFDHTSKKIRIIADTSNAPLTIN